MVPAGDGGRGISALKKLSALVIASMMIFCSFVITDTEKTDAAVGPSSGTCGANLEWSFDANTEHLTITGTGAMYDYNSGSLRWGGNVVRSVSFPDGMTKVGDFAFSECKIVSADLPNTVTTIGTYAFWKCVLMTSVTIPNGVTTIGEHAFEFCNGLTTVTLPSSVTDAGNWPFYSCSRLASINVEESNSNYASTDGVLFNKDRTVLMIYPMGKTDATYRIPGSVTTVNEWSFVGSKVREVIIPSGITAIPQSMFTNCSTLEKVTIEGNPTSIGMNAFRGCTNLRSMTIPGSVTLIDFGAFWGSGLTSVTIPAGVTGIGGSAFLECNDLTSITVEEPNNSYTSENGVLFNNDKTVLIKYPARKADSTYTVPDSVTAIEQYAFSNNHVLRTIAFGTGVTSIGVYAFQYCTGLTTLTIPDNVTGVGMGAFERCTGLTSVVIGNGITAIPGGVFIDCCNLSTVTIGNGVGNISHYAFGYCNITSFTVSDANAAYSSADGILFNKDRTVLMMYPSGKTDTSYSIPSTVIEITDEAFDGCPHLKRLSIPASVEYYDTDSFNCVNLESFSVSNSNQVLCTIDGVLFSKDKTALIQYPMGRADGSYTIPDGVNYLASNSFNNCYNLTSVTIPDSMMWIDDRAFSGCNIRTVRIPANVSTIHADTFSSCFELESFSVSSSNPYLYTVDGVLYCKDNLGNRSFIVCPAKYSGEVLIPNGSHVDDIYDGLIDCNGVTGFILEDDSPFYVSNNVLFRIDGNFPIAYASGCDADSFHATDDFKGEVNNVFNMSENLRSIDADVGNIDDLTSKDGCLYYRNYRLIVCPAGKTSLTLSPDTVIIDAGAFTGKNLEEVTFTAGSTVSVSRGAFINCSSLKKIVIEEGADVTFLHDSIRFMDGKEHTVYVVAPEGFELDTSGYTSNIKIVYGEPPADSFPWIYVGLGAAGAVVLIGVAVFLIRRR